MPQSRKFEFTACVIFIFPLLCHISEGGDGGKRLIKFKRCTVRVFMSLRHALATWHTCGHNVEEWSQINTSPSAYILRHDVKLAYFDSNGPTVTALKGFESPS